ncbi:glycine/betaine ABC transporter substrate-binding protein [Streptococcus cuniculi]|uniref:Glycine/betaine ABC transporter substrate-binding protein n=1 Tax=Streptococcus cuniculi TaxID=1432788 RepID=A0A4Y9JD72_9STRE|nr:glycine/betaine ABC transporter substrate-binding protein [Streptococcus cuniculi]MBF0777432.1 glycine/betaine ABC transporter substrate-binding protein [Streptococcus cuniculi]TFU98491.1 glycine/betaine ABC transporter substrate-binding protein [Streptococcus cuniculi]
MSTGELFYTYIDECKQNYLTQVMDGEGKDIFQEYSITSLTFPQNSYQEKLESEWKKFRNKYKFESSKALHFVDFKKLLLSEGQNESNPMYSYFLEDEVFSVQKLKEFFTDLQKILDDNTFFIVHTDYYWEKGWYLTKRNNIKNNQFKSKTSRNIAPGILNAVPYVAMKRHLDSLLLTLLKKDVIGHTNVPDGRYLDEEMPKKIYTKLRFDADGKEFDARTDLKKAYNHTVAIGSDNVRQDVAVEVLDEIRFIRKEEVGSKHTPSHCGLEIVDFLCSMIAGETRLEEYKKIHSDLSVDEGEFLNIKFEDGEIVKFYDIVMERIHYKTMNFLKY